MVEPGLTDDEIARIEDTFGFEFADDHRAFLTAGLRVGASWPDWRNEGRRSLAKKLQLPIEGFLFAVEWGQFWHDGWGPRPAQMKHALRTAKYHLERVPQLVPVHAHHYLPAGRGSSGHPVLSVVRTEVVVSAASLADYVGAANLADYLDGNPGTTAVPTVGFWSDLI